MEHRFGAFIYINDMQDIPGRRLHSGACAWKRKGLTEMKKILMLAVTIALILPSAASAEEPSPFRVYLGDRTTGNFIEAWKYYEEQRADTADYGAAVILAYMSMIEMEKNLGILEEHRSELKNKNMFSYGNMLLELGRYDEAIAIYDVLNEKTPKWSCPWRHKGEALWKKGELADAVIALNKAIETRETHYDAYVMLAEVYNDLEMCDKALATLEKGLTYLGKDIEDPEEEVAYKDVAFLHLDLLKGCGDKAKYEKLHEELKGLYPDDERLQ
jgi:tetratricopeptide (TPR) repeat protein